MISVSNDISDENYVDENTIIAIITLISTMKINKENLNDHKYCYYCTSLIRDH